MAGTKKDFLAAALFAGAAPPEPSGPRLLAEERRHCSHEFTHAWQAAHMQWRLLLCLVLALGGPPPVRPVPVRDPAPEEQLVTQPTAPRPPPQAAAESAARKYVEPAAGTPGAEIRQPAPNATTAAPPAALAKEGPATPLRRARAGLHRALSEDWAAHVRRVQDGAEDAVMGAARGTLHRGSPSRVLPIHVHALI
jgi:hypothetical protein